MNEARAETVAASAAGASTRLSREQWADAKKRLASLLSESNNTVQIRMNGGNSVSLGQEVVFKAKSPIDGRLAIIDVNADGEVTLLYPNSFVQPSASRHIDAGQEVTVPGPGYEGFDGFRAQEPLGDGDLLAFVAPPGAFKIEEWLAPAGPMPKGWSPFVNPKNQMTELLKLIAEAVKQHGSEGWRYGVTKYTITP